MKSLIAALSVLLTINTFASSSISEKCELRTDKPDLLHELNKKEICEATFYALFDSEVLEYDYYLRICLLYTSPSPRDKRQSRMPSSA